MAALSAPLCACPPCSSNTSGLPLIKLLAESQKISAAHPASPEAHLRPGGSASLPLPDGGLTRPLLGAADSWRAAAPANGEAWLPLLAGPASAGGSVAGCSSAAAAATGGGDGRLQPSSTDSSRERWLVGVSPSVSVWRALSPRRSGGAIDLVGPGLQRRVGGRVGG